MLPSSGYFRSVNCPFFESGLCERPHCHFRHVKKDPAITMRQRSTSAEDALPVGLSTPESKPDLLRLVSEAVLKMQREMDQGRSRTHVQAKPSTPNLNSAPSLNSPFLPNKFSAGLSDSNITIPVLPPTVENSSLLAAPLPTVASLPSVTDVPAITPLSSNKYLDSLKEDDPPIVPKRSASSSSSGQYMFVLAKDTIYRKTASTRASKSNIPVLEYKPTPIAELKKMKEQQNSKYGLTFKEQSVVDDLEYDPVLNFSAGFPNKKKKLVTPYSPHPVKRVPLTSAEEVGTESKRFRFCIDSDTEDLAYNDFQENASDHDAHFSDDDATSEKPLPSPEKATKEIVKSIKNEEVNKVESTAADTTCKFDIIEQILSESEKCKKAILDRTIQTKEAAVKDEVAEPVVQKESSESKILPESKDESIENSNEPSSTTLLSTDSSLLKYPNRLGSDTNKTDNKMDVSKTDSVQKSITKTTDSKFDASKTDTVQKAHSKNARSSSSHSSKNSALKHHSSKESSKSSDKGSKSASKDKTSRNLSHDKHSHSVSQDKHSHSSSQDKHSHSSSQEKHSHSSSHEKHSRSSSHEKHSNISSHSKHSSHDKSSHKSSSASHKSSSSKQDSSHKTKSNNSHESKSSDKHEKAKDKSVKTNTEVKSVHKKHSSSSTSKPEKDRRTSSSSDKSSRVKSTDSYSGDVKKHEKSKHRHENKTVKSPQKNSSKHASHSHRVKDKRRKHLSKRVSSSEDDYGSESSASDTEVDSSESDSASDKSNYTEPKNAKVKENKKYEKTKHKHESKVSGSPTKLSSKLSQTKGNNLMSSHRSKDEHRKSVNKNGSVNDDDFDSESSMSDAADHSSELAIADVDVDTDLDEHDTYEECLRIFNEYTPIDNDETKYKEVKASHRSKLEEKISSKHRVAHAGSSSDVTTLSRLSKPGQVPSKVSASQAMFNRYSKVQKMLNEQTQSMAATAAAAASAKPSAFLNSVTSNVPTKRRIAHVPNVSAIITATNTVKAIASNAPELASDQTVAQTNTKGANRIAHIPKQLTMPRPTIPAEYGSRVPCNVRQRYLNIIIDECLKIYDDVQDAFERALAEEKNAYQRSSNRTVYINVVVNNIKRIRSEVSGEVPVTPVIREVEPSTSNDPPSPVSPVMMSPPHMKSPPKPNPRTVSHQAVLGGKKAANVSYSIQRSKAAKPASDIAGHVLYRLLSSYILTEQQLIENCYPQAHPTNHGEAVIPNFDLRKSVSSNSLDRICRRCGARYKVSSKGIYLTQEECVYHYGKSFKRRVSGTIEHRYTCCEGDLSSEGCCCAPVHVSENIDMDCLTGYVTTLPKTPPINGDYGVFALDCEMCYTLKGLELTRLTVIGSNMKPVYETLVMPENPILDYNTKFSGITEEDMIGVRTTLRDVQAVLLSKFSSKTILIGHSLESDFKALKLIHGTVIDTSVVFPHRLGPPKKRALKTLMAEYLNKIIQNSVDGHDSQEDAISCMELMMWKVKEDLKKLIR